jgi:cytochrome b pre-mRNA-processing protein 3
MFAWLFGRKDAPAIAALYADLMAEVRASAPYRDHAVADTFEGRFEYLALVATLVLERLAALGPAANSAAQALVDQIFEGFDDAMRRHGVSDIAVGKRVKKLAKSFYGRVEAYRAGLAAIADGRGEAPLREALARNLYSGTRDPEALPEGLLRRLAHLQGALQRADLPTLMAGGVLAAAASQEG